MTKDPGMSMGTSRIGHSKIKVTACRSLHPHLYTTSLSSLTVQDVVFVRMFLVLLIIFGHDEFPLDPSERSS
jgi:hypothetical protein